MPSRLLLTLLFTLTFLSPTIAFADEEPHPFTGPDADLLRGDAYYYEGDFYRALSAYKDFLWANPADQRASRIRLKMAWLYRIGGDYKSAATILDELAREQADMAEGWWAQLFLGDVALRAERIALARRSYEGLLDLCEPQLLRLADGALDPEATSCLELTGRARLSLADLEATRHDFKKATAHLDALPDNSPYAQEAREIADLLREIRLPKKSPALAGALSIVPGLGHFYLGEWSNGILAMAWNGIFIYGLVDSILSKRYGQAALIGLLESIWYGGTIFGAIAGAHRFNRDARQVVETGLRRDIASLLDDTPWPAQFPVQTPAYLELRLDF